MAFGHNIVVVNDNIVVVHYDIAVVTHDIMVLGSLVFGLWYPPSSSNLVMKMTKDHLIARNT